MISERSRKLYQEIINNPYYEIDSCGVILKRADAAGNITPNWHEQKTYTKDNRLCFKYSRKEINLHLAVLAKYDRLPHNDEVVFFKDGNIQNCDVSNLEIRKKHFPRNSIGVFIKAS